MNLEDDHDLLIQLNSKVDAILESLRQVPPIEERVRSLEKVSEKREEQISTIKGEVDKLRNTNNVWSFVNTIGIVLAGILGISIK